MSSEQEWLPLLEELQRNVQSSISNYNDLHQICNERSFRKAFEDFCKQKREYDSDRIQYRFMPSYDSILDLARSVDKLAPDLENLVHQDRLESLVWRVSFALIDRGFQVNSRVESSTALVTGLNNTVPRFSDKKDLFPTVPEVQQPLQQVYRGYIESYLQTLSHLNISRSSYDQDLQSIEEIRDLIRKNTQIFQSARGKYDQGINHAVQDREREKAAKEQPTLEKERRKPSIIHPGPTSSREIPVTFVSSDRDPLGHGSFGEVDEVGEKTTGALFARKHIHLGHNGISEDEVRNEVAVMQKLHHNHICTVLFYIKDPEDKSCSIFMLPVAEYNLKSYLERCVEYNYDASLTKQITPWFGCLLDALAYAHGMKIIHRDIKPSNILIKSNQPYLSDFGFAKDITGADDSSSWGDVIYGTPAYRAPELRPGIKRKNSADIFSLGCTYSEMLTVTERRSLKDYIAKRQGLAFRDCLPEVNEWLSELKGNSNGILTNIMVSEIKDMIKEDPKSRPKASQSVGSLKKDRAFWCVEWEAENIVDYPR